MNRSNIKKKVTQLIKLPWVRSTIIAFEKYVLKRLTNKKTSLSVELVGPPGVGKSTIFQLLMNSKNKHDKWMSRTHFLKLIDRVESLSLEYKILLKLKDTIIHQKEHVATVPQVNKQKLMNWNRIVDDASVKNSHLKAFLISDESFLHHYGPSLEIMYQTHPDQVKELVKNRAIIFCTDTPTNIVNKISNRKKYGKTWLEHKGLSQDELIKLTETIIKKQLSWVSLLKTIGVPVLVINTSEDISLTTKLAKMFISDFFHRH